MRRFVAGRGFALALLGCAAAPTVVWAVAPDAGWMPLGIAILPWFALARWGSRPAFRTRLDPAIALFLIAATIGLWTAYDAAAALAKFRLILSAVLLYYALAYQPAENLWPVAGALAGLGTVISLPLLSADIGTAAGSHSSLPAASSDAYAGVMALTVPYILAVILKGHRLRSRGVALLACTSFIMVLAGLWASAERSAWVGAAVAVLVMFGWGARSIAHNSAARAPRSWTRGFLLLLGAAVVVAALAMLVAGGKWPAGFDSAPIAERLTLGRNSLRLASAFLLTGGGLASFPGLYSRYVLLIPVLFTTTSHNLFLDVLTELGAAGLLSLAAMACGSVCILRSRMDREPTPHDPANLLSAAAVGSIAALVAMGLIEDPLFATPGLGFLLVPFGMAAAVVANSERPSGGRVLATPRVWIGAGTARVLWAVGGGAVLLLLLVFGRVVVSSALANAGSVLLARSELHGWPSDTEPDSAALQGRLRARGVLTRAISIQPDNVSANFRLGLMAMDDLDFAQAREFLTTAWDGAPDHRGVRKALGYDLTWLEEFDAARPLLERIPEAPAELDVYAWWWGTQNRDDLAFSAARMSELLQPQVLTSP